MLKQSVKSNLCNQNLKQRLKEHELSDMELTIECYVEGILGALHIDWLSDHNMKDTPKRVAKMLVRETFVGRYEEPPLITDFPNVSNLDQLMAIGPIDVKSTCAHHLQPIYGKAWIGVLPNRKGRIIGLSKFNRIVDHFSRRPQIQEELTSQIAVQLQKLLKPKGLIVMVKARHFCMCARGVNQESDTVTSVAKGTLRDNPSLKSEFFNLISK